MLVETDSWAQLRSTKAHWPLLGIVLLQAMLAIVKGPFDLARDGRSKAEVSDTFSQRRRRSKNALIGDVTLAAHLGNIPTAKALAQTELGGIQTAVLSCSLNIVFEQSPQGLVHPSAGVQTPSRGANVLAAARLTCVTVGDGGPGGGGLFGAEISPRSVPLAASMAVTLNRVEFRPPSREIVTIFVMY